MTVATPSLPGGLWGKMILYQKLPPILAQALGFSWAELRGCELLRVTVARAVATKAAPYAIHVYCVT